MIIYLISGIWHGANWTFIVWGILYGLLSVFDRMTEKLQGKLLGVVRWGYTFFCINILWLLFRSETITQFKIILMQMFTFQNMNVSDGLIATFKLPEQQFILDFLHLNTIADAVRGFNILVFNILVFMLVSFYICLVPENNYKKQKINNVFTMIFASIAFVWGFLCLSSESVFVYFNF